MVTYGKEDEALAETHTTVHPHSVAEHQARCYQANGAEYQEQRQACCHERFEDVRPGLLSAEGAVDSTVRLRLNIRLLPL